jgi:arabinofuranosyltransferase
MLLGYAVVVVRTAWLSDDAYITFRTIDNFASGYGLRWNVAERVQTFTAPLWSMLVGAAYACTGEIYLTAIGLSILVSLSAVAIVGWQARSRGAGPFLLVAGIGALVVSRAFVDYSTSGLENPLIHLLLVLYFAVSLFGDPAHGRRLLALSLIAGLATLNRMDTALLVAPSLAWEAWNAWRSRGRGSVAALLLGFAPFLLWEAFSIVYYGYPFPNTAYAKLRTGIPRAEAWAQGVAYFRNSFARDPVTLAVIAGTVGMALAWRSARRTAAVAGILVYFAYVVNIGGDFMSGRFFAAPLAVAVLLLFDAGDRLQVSALHRLLPAAVLLLGCVGATPAFLTGGDYGRLRAALLDDSGVADERGYYYPMTGLLIDVPIAGRPASESALEGNRARERGDPLMVNGIVGFNAFRAGPDTYMVDYYGLGDPLLSRLPMLESDPEYSDFCIRLQGHPCASSWRAGHYVRNIPDGYLESILSDSNQLADANLRRYYDAVRLITRGPLWTRARFREIAKMNLGSYDAMLGPAERVDYRPTRFAPAYERHPDVRSVSVLGGAARNYLEGGEPAKAIECYRKLVALDPTVHEAWNNLGQLLLLAGDDAGEAALLEAIKLRPGRREPYASLAGRIGTSGRSSEIIGVFRSLADAGDDIAAEFLRAGAR